jgi:BolA protein
MQRQARIKTKLAIFLPTYLKITDESRLHIGHMTHIANETHFRIEISATELQTISKIQQHRMINKVLEEEFDTGLHALSIKIIS